MKEVKFYKMLGDIQYPTSAHIQSSLSTIKRMTSILTKIYGKEAPLVLWCRGSSGSIIATIVALKFPNSTIAYVKKEVEKQHGSYISSIFKPNSKHIIVDDFISSGETVNEIYKVMDDKGLEVDCMAVSGWVMMDKLDFTPNIIVSSRVYINGIYEDYVTTKTFNYAFEK